MPIINNTCVFNLDGNWYNIDFCSFSCNRALYGYEGQSNCLKVISTGDGGLVELADELNSGKIMYAFVSVQDAKTSLTKFLLINWQVSTFLRIKLCISVWYLNESACVVAKQDKEKRETYG